VGAQDRDGRGGSAAESLLAPLAAPLRAMGVGCFVLAGIVLLAVAGLAIAGELAFEAGLLVGPAVLLGLGLLLREAARRLAAGSLDLPGLAGLAFPAVGAAMALGGAVMVYDDPGGFALLALGFAFIGIGLLARRLFAPPGKKAVLVGGIEAPTRSIHGRRGIRRQAAVIHVDENASPAEVEAAKAAWLRARWEERPDWGEGRVLAEDERGGAFLHIAAGLWLLFALAGLAASLYWGGWLAWLVAAGAGIVAASLLVHAVLRTLRGRKFGESHFLLRASPVAPGGRLQGEIETGVPQDVALRDGFRLFLRCIHRWEETRRTDGAGSLTRTIYRRDILWQDEQRSAGHAGSGRRHLSVPVSFVLPAELPGSMLDGEAKGIAWELEISAAMPGIDYTATFKLPVLDPEAVRILAKH